MAKDNIALLNEIAGSLRKLNQSNIREQLKNQEFQKQQISIQGGQPLAEDQGPAFVDAAEDFRRRVKGSVTGAFAAEKVTASGIRARHLLKKADEEEEAFTATINSEKEEAKAAKGLSDIYELLVKWKDMQSTSARNAARDATENELEKSKFAPGMNPNSIANRIKPGFGLRSDDMPEVEIDEGNFISRNIKKVVAAVAIGGSMAISDVIRGYKRDGIDGAVSSFLGGNDEGSMANSIRQAFTVGTTGAAAGFMVGGPVGALVGGIGGMAVGALTGFLGASTINAWMDEAGKNISDAWAEMSGNFISIGRHIGRWIYTPGTAAAGPNKPAVNATMFGGLISWNIDEYGSTFTSAFIKVMDDIISLPGKIAAWIKRTINEVSPALGEFLFGDGLTTEEREAKRAMEVMTAAKTTSGSFKSGFEKAEVAFAGAFGQEEAENLFFGDTREAFIAAVRGGVYGLTGAANPGGELVLDNPALVTKADEERAANIARLMAEEEARTAALHDAKMKAKELRIMTQQTADRNLMRQSGYSQAPTIIPVDSSTSSVTTTINIEKKETLGSGNNNNSIMGEDGFIYSW